MAHAFSNVQVATFPATQPLEGECGEDAAKCPARRQVTTSTTTTTALRATANVTCGARQCFDGDCDSTAAPTRQQNCVEQLQRSREQCLHGGSGRAQGMRLKCPPADARPAGRCRTKPCEDARVLPCLVQPTCAHGERPTGASTIRRGEHVRPAAHVPSRRLFERCIPIETGNVQKVQARVVPRRPASDGLL